MTAEVVPLLARRRIEAELLSRVFAALRGRVGETTALEALAEAVEAAAEAAGREFAAAAPEGPSLGHFATVLERWQEGSALAIESVCLDGSALSFAVARCGYAELYRSLGLPSALGYVLSCRRDAAFARGYHPGLHLERPHTIAEGAPHCRFRFSWTPDP